MITILLATSILLTFCFITYSVIRNGELPDSISAIVFDFKHTWVWSIWLWAVGITLAPALMEAMPENRQVFAFLTLAALMFTGAIPLIDTANNKWHNILGFMAGVLSQCCVWCISPWWLLTWCIFFILPFCDRKWYMPGLPMWLIRSKVFIAECVCFVTEIGSLLTY